MAETPTGTTDWRTLATGDDSPPPTPPRGRRQQPRWTNLADYAPLEHNAILNSMRTHLVTAAQTRLPAIVPNRDQALDLLQNLADLATHIAANNPQ